MTEEWRDIPGYEGHYQISNHGRVRSLKRDCIMALSTLWSGYLVVWLRRPPTHHRKHFVHRLVAEAFLPNPRELPVVNHKDADRSNPHLSNLEWVTFSENTQHYFRRKRAEEARASEKEAETFDESDIPEFSPTAPQAA